VVGIGWGFVKRGKVAGTAIKLYGTAI